MKKKKLMIALSLIVVGAAAFLLFRSRGTGESTTLTLSGNVEVTEAHIGFKISGRVVELAVEEGQRVEQGALLARLDNEELASVARQSGAALQEARTRLAELRTGSRIQEIEQARAAVSSAEAELHRARKDYARAEALYGKEAIPASQLDAARSAFDSSAARHRNALEALSLAEEGPRTEEKAMAEQRVEQARAVVSTAEARLKDAFIRAPFDGIVLRKNVELGETVGPGTPVYTMGDLAHPWIKVYVKEDKLGLVQLGQRALVQTDSFPGKEYEGVVTFVSSEAEFTPKTIQTQEERVKLVFGVKVRVANDTGELKPGMPADVRLPIKDAEDRKR